MDAIRFVGVALLLFLVGCKDAESPVASTTTRATLPEPTLERVALLADQLPPETAVYFRLPSPWDWLGGTRDDALGPVKNTEAHRAVIEQLKVGLLDQAKTIQDFAGLPLLEFMGRMQGPLEVAMLKPPDGSLAPESMIVMQTDITGADDMRTFLEALAADSEQIRVISDLDDNGRASLLATMVPMYMKHDARSGRVSWLSGITASADRLDTYDAALTKAASGKLPDHELAIDTTGSLPALWIDVPLSWEWVGSQLPAAQREAVESLGLHEAEFVWFGSTSRDGLASLRLDVGLAENRGLRRYLPTVDATGDTSMVGDPRLFMRLALPTAEEFERQQAAVLEGFTEEDSENYISGRQALEESLGYSVNDVLAALGSDVLLIGDDAGYYWSVGIRDASKLDLILDNLGSLEGHDVQRRTVAGYELGGWRFPTLQSSVLDQALEEGDEDELALLPKWLITALTRPRSRLYWRKTKDRLLIATVPQVLIDQAQAQSFKSFSDWTENDMDLELRHALVAAGGQLDTAPREFYYAYLDVLAILGDVLDVDVDLFTLPTASQAGLADAGRYAVQLDAGADALSLTISYEHSAFELIATDSPALLTVAAVGVVAAIAVPAYNDYERRADVAAVIAEADVVMGAVAEYRTRTGAFPNEERAELESRIVDEPLSAWIEVSPETGDVRVVIYDDLLGEEMWILFEPFEEPEGVWQYDCVEVEGLSDTMLPPRCR